MHRLSTHRYPNRVFLTCFLFLNLLLFLPLYLLNWEDATLFPITKNLGWDWWADLQYIVLWRQNMDPFRWNIELVILVALWVNVRHLRRPGLRQLFITLYFLTLFYYAYEAITVSIYQVEPIFYHHYYLVADGLQFLLDHLSLSMSIYLISGVCFLLALLLVYLFAQLLYSIPMAERLSPWLRGSFGLVAVFMLLTTFSYQRVMALPIMVMSSIFYKVEGNVEKSLQVYHDVMNFDDTQLRQVYDYGALKLQRKPNIYFLFVESYGSVLYKRPDYKIGYQILLEQLQKQLTEGGWQTTSTLSESPTWGGGSWLAYTSTLFGLRIDTHPQFLALLNKYQLEAYPNLSNYLKQQGYHYYHLSSLSSELPEGDWLKQERFYGVDHWFRYEELKYEGPLYGWGPAPPDQYALSYTHDLIKAGADQPFMLFFITQNSHYPFAPFPTLVPDWRSLNEAGASPPSVDAENIAHDLRRRNYANAIHYELEALVDFILKEGHEDDLFVLIGDHQPPRVSRRNDGFDTPVHIISQNGAFLDAFQEYGFASGLQVAKLEPTIKHEGFYSLFMRALLATYGDVDQSALPPYLPDGFVAEPSAVQK